MRNIYFAIILMLLCLSLFAEEQEVPKFALLSPVAYNIDLRVNTSLQRMYINAEFSVMPVLLRKADYYSFFLSKSARVEKVFVQDKPLMPLITKDLVPEHFEPVLPIPELLTDSTLVNCFSYNLEPYKSEETAIKFRFSYWIPLPEWKSISDGASSLEFPTDTYWYPRNIETESRVNVQLVSTLRFSLDMGPEVQVLETENIRTSQGYFTDNPLQPYTLRITKR